MYERLGYKDGTLQEAAQLPMVRGSLVPAVFTTADEMVLASPRFTPEVTGISIPIILTASRSKIRPKILQANFLTRVLDISQQRLSDYADVAFLSTYRVSHVGKPLVVLPFAVELDLESDEIPCYPNKNEFDWMTFDQAQTYVDDAATSSFTPDSGQLNYHYERMACNIADSSYAVRRYFELHTEFDD